MIAVVQDNHCFVARDCSSFQRESWNVFLHKDSWWCGFLSCRARHTVYPTAVPGRSLSWLNLKGVPDYLTRVKVLHDTSCICLRCCVVIERDFLTDPRNHGVEESRNMAGGARDGGSCLPFPVGTWVRPLHLLIFEMRGDSV